MPDGVEICMLNKRKELTTVEKQENKRISEIRINVEHAIGGMKNAVLLKNDSDAINSVLKIW